MKINTKVRYGLRAMIEVAEKGKFDPVRTSELAQSQDLSVKYLEALMVKLKNAGLVHSVRGNKGGYLLARKASTITAYDIFLALDESFEIVPCLCEDRVCERNEFCGTKELWKELAGSMENKLKAIRLENLTEN
ncbi:MAG: Rrf2 family transcriptional regulator [Rhodothermaceae bacterium]